MLTEEDPEPLVPVRTEEPAAPLAEIRQAAPEEAVAPAAAPSPAQSEALPADGFEKAAEAIARSLTECWLSLMHRTERQRQFDDARLETTSSELKKVQEEAAELRNSLDAQRRLIETEVLAVIGRIGSSLERLEQTVQSQAEAIAGLSSAKEGLLRSQEGVHQRLDAQAEAVRDLSAAASAQQDRWAEYRSAVERLREITEVPSLPVQLPENL